MDFSRRLRNHDSRIMFPTGSSQQPFYDVIRCGATELPAVRACASAWFFLPCRRASLDRDCRKAAEEVWIEEHRLLLNSPSVYAYLQWLRSSKLVHSCRLKHCYRPLLRLRVTGCCRVVKISKYHSAWKAGLQMTARAVAGHHFHGSQEALNAAWKLAPGPWAFLVSRVDRLEEDWRRVRGIRYLRLIASYRKDLVAPICRLDFSLPWSGRTYHSDVLRRCVHRLIQSWRSQGMWIPIRRHAKFHFSWSSTSTVRDLLCSGAELPALVSNCTDDLCRCEEFLKKNPSWPSITFEGKVHIASIQSEVPWPTQIQHLADWPVSLNLLPRRHDIECSITSQIQRLRKRCKVAVNDGWSEQFTQTIINSVWSDIKDTGTKSPISWFHISFAKRWLKPFFVQIFDHNVSRLGVFCKHLVARQAVLALEYSVVASRRLNFVWDTDCDARSILLSLTAVPCLNKYIDIAALSRLPEKDWKLGFPNFLPKWKGPGLLWRLLINKHFTPCCVLHSICARAIDFAITSWSACDCELNSNLNFVDLCTEFNEIIEEKCGPCQGITAAGDMKDCFHHLPCEAAPSHWELVVDHWHAQGIRAISIPIKPSAGKPRFGIFHGPGWIVLYFEDISAILSNFASTNYVQIGDAVGREARGAPMGDPLSSAILRLWKFKRESDTRCHENVDCTPLACSKIKVALIHGVCTWILDCSYRDDVRIFCAWPKSSALRADVVHGWAFARLKARYMHGTMVLEESDMHCFIGLHTIWVRKGLRVWPKCENPWVSSTYNNLEHNPLKPWESWQPLKQKRAMLTGLLCRAVYCSTDEVACEIAIRVALATMILKARFPAAFVKTHAKKWAGSWTPKRHKPFCLCYADVVTDALRKINRM